MSFLPTLPSSSVTMASVYVMEKRKFTHTMCRRNFVNNDVVTAQVLVNKLILVYGDNTSVLWSSLFLLPSSAHKISPMWNNNHKLTKIFSISFVMWIMVGNSGCVNKALPFYISTRVKILNIQYEKGVFFTVHSQVAKISFHLFNSLMSMHNSRVRYDS